MSQAKSGFSQSLGLSSLNSEHFSLSLGIQPKRVENKKDSRHVSDHSSETMLANLLTYNCDEETPQYIQTVYLPRKSLPPAPLSMCEGSMDPEFSRQDNETSSQRPTSEPLF